MKKQKNKASVNTYVINTILKPQKCNNCKKKKPIHYYELKDRVWGKILFRLAMCKDCLEELKMRIMEQPGKEIVTENMVQVINAMLKENDHVHKQS